jgi:hypothetical protein
MSYGTPSGRAPASADASEMTVLIYELLDAHDDTARLVSEMASERVWELHLDYIRDLQRAGRAMLADMTQERGR